MEQYQKVRAKFTPQRTDDLKGDLATKVGMVDTFEACWIIEDGSYKDQWAMGVVNVDNILNPHGVWVPECDLTIID